MQENILLLTQVVIALDILNVELIFLFLHVSWITVIANSFANISAVITFVLFVTTNFSYI